MLEIPVIITAIILNGFSCAERLEQRILLKCLLEKRVLCHYTLYCFQQHLFVLFARVSEMCDGGRNADVSQPISERQPLRQVRYHIPS